MDQEIEKYIEEYNIPIEEIPEDRQYWFLRTQGGAYYSEFFTEGFIAINWEKLTNPTELLHLEYKQAIETVKRAYPDEKRPGKIYNQIQRFCNQMKKGDVVMIPGILSNHIAFGIIETELVIENDTDKLRTCPYVKRKGVKWIKQVNRHQMDPYLYRMTRPQNAISNANEYAQYIDRTLHDFYVKGNKAHLVLGVNTTSNIPLLDLYDLMSAVLEGIKITNDNELFDREFTLRDIDVKLTLNSPGIVELFTEHWKLLFAVGGIIVVAFGGKVSFLGQSVETKTSLLEWLSKLQEQKHVKEMKKLELEHDLKRLAQEHKHLKDRLKLQLPSQATTPDDKEKKIE
ncbi:hypothetical protein [Brevibacillus reuszeri]|uniref:hypothetical protein n=1 Tax=Brevibacillus reuszeri TaxID=54915 RepID=UPI000CCC2D5B|nr:hypothetical protein [Brevibacillus reuszeri]